MRILHIINVRWWNATAWYAFRLAKAGRDKGDYSAIAGLAGSPVVEAAKEYGIDTLEAEFTTNNIFKIRKTIAKTCRFIEEVKPDIVVCHRGEMFWWFSLYKYFFSPSWRLIRVRGDIRPPTTDILSRFMHNKCTDAIVTSANIIKKRFLDGLKTPESHITTIYGGVDTSVFKKDMGLRAKVRQEFGYKDNDYVVSVVGRFDPVKGHDIFLKGCGLLYKGGMSNLKVLLVGFPENVTIPEIEKMIDDNGLKDIAVITGRRNDVQALMNASDLGVISSMGSEAICRVAMEFMACGVPVVSSDAGVLPEMFSGSNIYPMDSAETLAERIKNHDNYLKLYSETDFYSLFKDVCNKVLKK